MQSEFKQQSIPEYQYLWSISQISLASSFAGPMAGCYFLGKNFQQLGLLDHAKKCYLTGVIGSVLLFMILFLSPENLIAYLPPICIPAISGVIASYAHSYQKQLIQENIDKGAKLFSYWWCILIILSFVVIQVPLSLFYALLLTIIF